MLARPLTYTASVSRLVHCQSPRPSCGAELAVYPRRRHAVACFAVLPQNAIAGILTKPVFAFRSDILGRNILFNRSPKSGLRQNRPVKRGGFNRIALCEKRLCLFNSDGTSFTAFHTGFTAQAVFGFHRRRLATLHFIDFGGAHISAFTTANTFVLIDGHIIGHCRILLIKDG